MATTEKSQLLSLVEPYFKEQPTINDFYFTSDGLPFYTQNMAQSHAAFLEDKTVLPVTRKGYELLKEEVKAEQIAAATQPEADEQLNSSDQGGSAAGGEGQPGGSDEQPDYSTYNKSQLQLALNSMGIEHDAKDTKAELLTKLMEALKAPAATS